MATSKKNPLTLIAGIRFQLDQLNAANAHHEFEHLCRHLARARISKNILPATGPVSAGGDQGRDFESFTSFVGSTAKGSTLFLGVGESQPLVFACSLQRASIEKKIKSDVDEIVASGRPYIIYFLSNQNISVAVRHRLQAWCLETHSVRLEILDANAISELLSSSSTFWIAEEFLRVPSELFPAAEGPDDDPYNKARKKWIEGDATPYNYADFVDIKFGLRRATFKESAKSDLRRWLQAMENFLADAMPEELRRRAAYEICVASLRGMNNLDSRKDLVCMYFSNWGNSADTTLLSDATVLASYCTTAQLGGQFQISPTQLHVWTKELAKTVDGQLQRNPSPNRKAELLAVRAHLCQLAYLKSEEPTQDTDEVFKYWASLVAAAKAAPLYPIEDFADILTKLAPYLESDQRYKSLISRVEKILEERSKSYVVADKSRDRAVELLKAGKTLAAIDQLHRARVRWFTGDTIRGSLLASLTLSEAYSRIGMEFAAKYHAMGVAFVAAKSSDEDLKRYLTNSLHQLGMIQYSAGEWMSMSLLFPLFLSAHYSHSGDPDDWQDHPAVQGALMHYLIARSWAKALGGDAAKKRFESSLRNSNIPIQLQQEVLDSPLSLEQYEQMSAPEIGDAVAKEFWGQPFADCGTIRTYRWRSFGVSWEIVCANTFETIPVVEQFVAVLQVVIVELARSELCLLPTAVELRVNLGDSAKTNIVPVPDNNKIVFEVSLTERIEEGAAAVEESATETLAIASHVLISCSALSDEQVKKVIRASFQNELPARSFLVRPYSELWREFASEEEFEALFANAVWNGVFELRQHHELRWPDGPGPGYSKKKADEFLANRYRRAIVAVRKSLLRYRKSQAFIAWVSMLRAEGMLDWQILNLINNAVLNYRIGGGKPIYDPEFSREGALRLVNVEESDNDLQVPEEFIFGQLEMFKATSVASNASTWGLTVRQQTPNFGALKQLLDVRYFQATDDVPHEDLFSPL